MSIKDEPIMSYPDRRFSLDYPNQLRMDTLMSHRARITAALVFASIAAVIGFAATGWQPLGYVWFPLLLAAAILAMRRAPKFFCTHCGERMQRESVPCNGSDEEEFLVCVPCRRYTFNHRRSMSG